ncbi:uncharacterized protein GIQ15_00036 [Arthroderma uncinatum]|uniref:uncharacterized protein n=1 Tax=Arthroderma uncinatum TaxID=74035 RepID=UPI00144A736E|nr:uncharacterized protein GIQ15_00036 [Arthroderma uncinatum]KAF3490519.1 hypothetical protein GIQ15_00036 [Arthroderma uncinatum]
MRFTIPGVLALAMAGSTAVAGTLPSLTCLKAPSVIQAFDINRGLGIWQKELCDQGCDIRLSNYQTQIREVAIYAIKTESANMGASELVPHYITLLDAWFDLLMKTCGASKFGDVNLCSPDVPMTQLLQCMKWNAFQTAWENSASIWPILSTHCQKQYDFFANDNFLVNVAPAHAQKFAAEQCKKV